MENQLFSPRGRNDNYRHPRGMFHFSTRKNFRSCIGTPFPIPDRRNHVSRVDIYVARPCALFSRSHRGMSSPSLLSLSSCVSYAIVRKRRCRYSVRPMRPAALLGMHRSRHGEEKRRKRRRIELSWFAAGVINVRALGASTDHIAFVINRFGGFPRPPAPFAIMSCTFHYKFPLVSLPLRVYIRAREHTRENRRERRTLEDRKGSRIRRGKMYLLWDDVERKRERGGDKAKEWTVSPLRGPRDINSCYSYVYRRAISRGSTR